MPRKTLVLASVLLLSGSAAGVNAEYKKKVDEFRDNHTKERFLQDFNKERDWPVKGRRADRIWEYFNEQLDNGRVNFLDDGSVRYSLPLSDFLAPYLPEAVLVPLEATFKAGRSVHYMALNAIPESLALHFDLAFEVASDSGALHGFVAVSLGIIILKWFIFRFTDGISPSQRKMQQETRRRAAEYLKKKDL